MTKASYCSANLLVRTLSYSSRISDSFSLSIRSQIRPTCLNVKTGFSDRAGDSDCSPPEPLSLSEFEPYCNCLRLWNRRNSARMFAAITSGVSFLPTTSGKAEPDAPLVPAVGVPTRSLLGLGVPQNGMHRRRFAGRAPNTGSQSNERFNVAHAMFVSHCCHTNHTALTLTASLRAAKSTDAIHHFTEGFISLGVGYVCTDHSSLALYRR